MEASSIVFRLPVRRLNAIGLSRAGPEVIQLSQYTNEATLSRAYRIQNSEKCEAGEYERTDEDDFFPCVSARSLGPRRGQFHGSGRPESGSRSRDGVGRASKPHGKQSETRRCHLGDSRRL